ncbi:hypothetical protein [Cellulosimicrobium cellulans]|uniref:hypothetical protein n=1 Tax=Cellulosimicrobium cellulans TaxID=1710 RepID=UPI0005BB3A5D|nr:hypothetical protein [Cellulosimicrobium cellulans]
MRRQRLSRLHPRRWSWQGELAVRLGLGVGVGIAVMAVTRDASVALEAGGLVLAAMPTMPPPPHGAAATVAGTGREQ